MTTGTRRHTTAASHKQLSVKEEHSETVAQLQDIFPAWSAEDLELALSDVNGDLEIVIHRISEGHIQPWSEQGKKPVQAITERPAPSRRNAGQQRLARPTSHTITSKPGTTAASGPQSSSGVISPQTTIGKAQGAASSGTDHRKQRNTYEKPAATVSASNSAGNPREDAEASLRLVASGVVSEPLMQIAVTPASTKRQDVSRAEPIRYRSKHSQKTDADENKRFQPASASTLHEPSEESLHRYVQGIVGETDRRPPVSGDANPSSLNMPQETPVSVGLPAPSLEDETPSHPVVQMPSSLSSRISTSHLVQPVVVLPLRATMRPGLSVNFGGSLQQSRQQQQSVAMSTEQVAATTNIGYTQSAYYPAMVVGDDSNRRPYDVNTTEVKTNQTVIGAVPAVPSYRTMGIETSIESHSNEFATGSAAAQQTRKNQPIQRPNLPRDSFAVSSPPPGLRPTLVSTTGASSATSSETSMMVEDMRIKGHHQQTFLPEDNPSVESSTPNLTPYYHQVHQHQYQQPSHHDRSYAHGRSHTGSTINYQQQQQSNRSNPSSPAYHQGYGNTYTSRPFDNIVSTGNTNGNGSIKPPFDPNDRMGNGPNPSTPTAPWSPYVNSATASNQPPGQYYGNASAYSQGFYADEHHLNYGPGMPLQQHSAAGRPIHQYHHQPHSHQYGRSAQQQGGTQHLMDQSAVPEAGVSMQYSSFYGHANVGGHSIHGTYSGTPNMTPGNRRNPSGYLHPQPSAKNL